MRLSMSVQLYIAVKFLILGYAFIHVYTPILRLLKQRMRLRDMQAFMSLPCICDKFQKAHELGKLHDQKKKKNGRARCPVCPSVHLLSVM